MNQETKPSNPIAFPTLTYSRHSGDVNGHEEGMTLRDYFAAKAMQGSVVCDGPEFPSPDTIAKWSYSVADAMLKQREL